MKNGMQNIRDALKAEREYYRREELRRKKLQKREIEHVRKTDGTDRRGEGSGDRTQS
jgi:hypothetical protein